MNTRKKATTNRMKKMCKCAAHSPNSSNVINLSNRKISVSVVSELVNKKLITWKTKFVCEECVAIYTSGETEDMDWEDQEDTADDGYQDVHLVVLEEGHVVSDATPTVEHAPGGEEVSEDAVNSANDEINDQQSNDDQPIFQPAHEHPDIQFMKIMDAEIEKDIRFLYKQKPCKDAESLIGYDLREWLAKRPPTLISHLKKLCHLGDDTKSCFLLAHMVENMYNCRNARLVLPLSFRENIVTYKISNSAVLSALNGSFKPSGAHTYLTNWLNEAASQPPTFPDGTVHVVFDNEQVVGKRYHVDAEKTKVPLSLITSHVYLMVDRESDIQYREDLKPDHWMFKTVNEDLITTVTSSFSSFGDTFRVARNNLISSRLQVLQKHQFNSNDGYKDEITELVEEKELSKSTKHCTNCGKKGLTTQRVCKDCKGPMEIRALVKERMFPRQIIDPYDHLRCEVNISKVGVKTGEPDMVKPNSIQNIKKILQNLGKRADISEFADETMAGRRQWLFLENDGGIFNPILKLIFDARQVDTDEENCQHPFSWIVPQMGLLHLEINGGKSFMI